MKLSILLLFLVGTLCALSMPAHVNASQQSPPPEIPTVTLCALLSKPEDYNGKEIRVRAQYNLGFEWSFFAGASCKDYAVESTPFWTGNVIWAEFEKAVDASTKPEIYQRLIKARSLCCPSGWRTSQTEMVVVGKFLQAHDRGYGHEGRFAFELVVSKVEEVGDTKLVDP